MTKILKYDSSLPKFKEVSWYIDYPNLLAPLKIAYFTKLSNLQELRTNYSVSEQFPRGELLHGKSPLPKLHLETHHDLSDCYQSLLVELVFFM